VIFGRLLGDPSPRGQERCTLGRICCTLEQTKSLRVGARLRRQGLAGGFNERDTWFRGARAGGRGAWAPVRTPRCRSTKVNPSSFPSGKDWLWGSDRRVQRVQSSREACGELGSYELFTDENPIPSRQSAQPCASSGRLTPRAEAPRRVKTSDQKCERSMSRSGE
jgi:hypothetical protein